MKKYFFILSMFFFFRLTGQDDGWADAKPFHLLSLPDKEVYKNDLINYLYVSRTVRECTMKNINLMMNPTTYKGKVKRSYLNNSDGSLNKKLYEDEVKKIKKLCSRNRDHWQKYYTDRVDPYYNDWSEVDESYFWEYDGSVSPFYDDIRKPQLIVDRFFGLLQRWNGAIWDYDRERLASEVIIRYAPLKGGTIAIAAGMNDDEKIHIIIDAQKWSKASLKTRVYIMYHELIHDFYNIEHGEGNIDLMFPIVYDKADDMDAFEIDSVIYEVLEYLEE